MLSNIEQNSPTDTFVQTLSVQTLSVGYRHSLGVCRRVLYTILLNITEITQYCQNYTMFLNSADPACPLQVSMAIPCFDIAVGMSPEACFKSIHVAAQYTLSQGKIDMILHDEELDSYLFTFGEAQKALTNFHYLKTHVWISRMFLQEKEQRLQSPAGLT